MPNPIPPARLELLLGRMGCNALHASLSLSLYTDIMKPGQHEILPLLSIDTIFICVFYLTFDNGLNLTGPRLSLPSCSTRGTLPNAPLSIRTVTLTYMSRSLSYPSPNSKQRKVPESGARSVTLPLCVHVTRGSHSEHKPCKDPRDLNQNRKSGILF